VSFDNVTRPSMLAIFSPLLATGSMQREAFVITADTSGLRFRHTAQTLTSLGFVVWPFAPVDARDSRVLEIEKKYIRVNESLGMARRAISLTLTHMLSSGMPCHDSDARDKAAVVEATRRWT